ncbi:MAG: uroporphyrinogen-III C-methyltransferase [Deferribacteraceae bacterium]|jgi:uroporphyrin-III C-methyltransferase|nr:uroporphyrinogen-III C-methyltransferase [Deferribacteraceae bacterium]
MQGKYIAVGAGSAADLITLRGFRALSSADIILYDSLIDTAVLEGLEAEKVYVGKTAYQSHVSQDEINQRIEQELMHGKTVARLKGGDSLLFSRIAEELTVARSCKAEIEIIPGVTAASSALAKVQAPLTDRLTGSGAIFLTGHAKAKGEPHDDDMPDYDWASLAASKLTLVIYMGAKHIAAIATKLIASGLAADTPALTASKLGQTDESLEISTVAELAKGSKAEQPTIFVIGKVLA